MRKIGILGGTFDPIHYGHLMMAKAAYEEAGLDEVWYMPTGTPAYKQGMRSVSDRRHRANMTELAVKEDPHGRCSYIELEREGNTYTAETITELNSRYPRDRFYYIVGADSLDYMDRWYHPQQIFEQAIILVVMRSTQSIEQVMQKISELTAQFHGDIRLLKHPQMDISSTMLRRMAAKKQDISAYVPEGVRQYILDQGLYRECVSFDTQEEKG